MAGLIYRLITFPLYILLGFNTAGGGFTIPTLVLTDYVFNEDEESSDGVVLELVGRRGGLIAWVMNKLNIISKFYVRITNQDVQISLGGMSGSEHFVAPLSQITTSDLRLEKPVWRLYMACLLLIAAIPLLPTVIGAIIVVLIALFLLWSYRRSQRLVVAFSTSNIGDRYGLAFEPKRLTGKYVDFETLFNSMEHVNRSILNAHLSTEL